MPRHQRIFRRLIDPIAMAGAILALSACATTRTDMDASHSREQARLAAMIEGKEPGEPRSCITAFTANRLHILDHTAIVYDAGDTLWVSRPVDPHSLDTNDIVVIERTGGQLCKQDIIRTVDGTSGITTGVVFMGDFVPYR